MFHTRRWTCRAARTKENRQDHGGELRSLRDGQEPEEVPSGLGAYGGANGKLHRRAPDGAEDESVAPRQMVQDLPRC